MKKEKEKFIKKKKKNHFNSKQSLLISQRSFKSIHIIGKFITATFKKFEKYDKAIATYINIL